MEHVFYETFLLALVCCCEAALCIIYKINCLCFQNFLRQQNNKNNYNLVCETLQFLEGICGSTTGGLGLLGLYINESNVALINQTLASLTEYCQGPCHENQVSIYLKISIFLIVMVECFRLNKFFVDSLSLCYVS